ncbi:MAG: hypothetical protein HXL25_02105 [Porphyromonadaceae bacterium]|nr:hypothetical protein [Porphyromonadaceae bacterium]
MASKPTTIRAYHIEQESTLLSSGNECLLKLLREHLPETSAGDRRMRLSKQEDEEDFLSFYDTANSYLFGAVLNITPGSQVGEIQPEKFAQAMITTEELETMEGDDKSAKYKQCYYFALNASHLVTTLPGNAQISRLETYLNWLLRDKRDDAIFKLRSVITKDLAFNPSELREIVFLAPSAKRVGSPSKPQATEEKATFSVIWDNIGRRLGFTNDNMQELITQDAIQAELCVKFMRPRHLKSSEYERLIGYQLRNISDLGDVKIKVGKGKKQYIAGNEILREKTVQIELTRRNRLVEEQLKQEMERFLVELKKE